MSKKKLLLNHKPVYHTAFCLIPPQDQWSQIQEIRKQFDRAFIRWMPHINFLFPFYDLPNFDELEKIFIQELSEIGPFKVVFSKINFFQHAKKCVMFLDPITKPRGILKKIFKKLIEKCPNLKIRDEFNAHLTLGQFPKNQAEKMRKKFEKGFKPIEFVCDQLYMIHRSGQEDDPFKIVKSVKFFDQKKSGNVENDAKFVVKSCYSKLNEKMVGINLEIEMNDDLGSGESIRLVSKKVVIVLDISGSMAGSGLRSALIAIVELLKSTSNNSNIKYEFITFDSNSKVYPFSHLSLEDQIKLVQGIRSGGSTNFSAAFKSVFEVTKASEGEEISIVFFTDGQDGEGTPRQRTEIIKKGNEGLKQRRNNFEYHTIGFTSSHDAKLLTEITRQGETEGTFQYCKQASDILNSVTNLTSSLECKSISAFVETSTVGKRTKIFLSDIGENQFRSTFFVENSIVEKKSSGTGTADERGNLTLIIQDSAEVFTFHLSPIEKKFESEIDEVKLFIEYLQFKIMTNIEKIPDGSKTELNKIKNEMDVLDKEFDEKIKLMFKIRNRMAKKEMLNQSSNIKQLITTFYEAISSGLAKNLTNDKIASLNNLAYKNISKKGLKKKLDKRIAKNMNMFEKLDKQLDEEVKKIDFVALKAKYSKLAENFGKCILSQNNFVEAMEQSDCLCITVEIVRSQAAIADPAQTQIKGIKQTVISAESFLDSVLYKLQNNPLHDDTLVHSGFNTSQQSSQKASVVVGVARENVTGCLPVFICPEHWKIAKLKLKPILGWLCTLDPLGYAFAQIANVPFLIMEKAAESYEKSEFQKAQYEMIFNTCQQIFKEFKLCENVKPLLDEYNKSPLNRTVDKISKNEIFLMKLLCGVKVGEIKLPETVFERLIFNMIEEELRRKQPREFNDVNVDKSKFHEFLFSVLNVDKQVHVIDHVTQFKQNYLKNSRSNYASKFLKLVESKAETIINDSKKNDKKDIGELKDLGTTPIVIDYAGALNSFANGYLNKLEKVLIDWISPVLNNGRFFFKNFKLIKNFESMKLTNEQKLSLLIQNIQGFKNAKRREHIESGDYKDPINFSKDILYKYFETIVNEEKRKLCTTFLGEISKNVFTEKCEIFRMSKDLNEIAGVIYGITSKRSEEYTTFLKILKFEKVEMFLEKLEILVNGKYQGVNLLIEKKEEGNKDTEKPKNPKEDMDTEKTKKPFEFSDEDIITLFINNYKGVNFNFAKFRQILKIKSESVLKFLSIFEANQLNCESVYLNNFGMSVTQRIAGLQKFAVDEKLILKELVFSNSNRDCVMIISNGTELINIELLNKSLKEFFELWDKLQIENATTCKIQSILCFKVPKNIPIYINKRILNNEWVYTASGVTGFMLKMKSKEFVKNLEKMGYKVVIVDIPLTQQVIK